MSPASAISFLAAATSTVELQLLVTGVTYRHPGLLAKIVTTLDVLSGGRAWLGLGAAWNEDESRGLGFPFPPLGERFEKIRSTMPKGNPRSLYDQTYLDIVGYLLQSNGVPAGNDKLLPNLDALNRIVITIPAPAPGSSGRRR